MKKIKEMNIGEVGAYVCSFLNKHGIKCVLSGGACISIYSENKYESYELDFIENVSIPRKELSSLMSKIGFSEENRYFKHPETKFFVEFPSGPLSIGAQPVTEINEIEFESGKLSLLTPTDSVKDRLAAYFFWDDKQALEQAILVTESQDVDINEVRKWSISEGQSEKFSLIKKNLKRKNKSSK